MNHRVRAAVVAVTVVASTLACGGDSATPPDTPNGPPNPVPAIAGFTPPFLVAGAGETTVSITGSNFTRQSSLLVGGVVPRSATFISPGELRVTFTETELDDTRVYDISVVNPAPGGGTSNAMALQVRRTVPTLASLSHTETAALQEQFQLRLIGSGFMKHSVAMVNGSARSTGVVSATELVTTLTANDLADGATLEITVSTPAPDGGTSNPLPFRVNNLVPLITLLPSYGAHAGRGGFALFVHGYNFSRRAVVRWNGSARPTQFLSPFRLVAEVADADVAAPGTAQVTVFNPAPGGGPSNAAVMNIRSLPAVMLTASDTFPLSPKRLIADAQRSRLYLTIGPRAKADVDHLVTFDPGSHTVTNRLFLGSAPGALARSDDGQFLYVGFDTVNTVSRVDLQSFAAVGSWSLPAEKVVGDMLVMPGRPRSVVVSYQRSGCCPGPDGVTIYDDGVARLQSLSRSGAISSIVSLGSADTLYGANFDGFVTVTAKEQGLNPARTSVGLIGPPFVGASGRIYSRSLAVDAATHTRVGSMISESGAILVDPQLGRLFGLSREGLQVFDLNTFTLLGSISLFPDYPAVFTGDLVRWGPDGLAFIRDNIFAAHLQIIRSPLFAP